MVASRFHVQSTRQPVPTKEQSAWLFASVNSVSKMYQKTSLCVFGVNRLWVFLSFALIQKENTAKASTINVSRTPLGICFQFAIGSTFERNFFPLFFYLLFFPLPIPGTVTSVKSPFIIITSVECPFIKSWIPVLYRGKLSHGDLLSNDCYKALSLWEKLDSKGGENKTANKPSPLPPLWEFHKALVNSAPNKEGTAFFGPWLRFTLGSWSFEKERSVKNFTNQHFSYPRFHLLCLKLALLLNIEFIHLLLDILSSSSVFSVLPVVPTSFFFSLHILWLE